MSSRDSLDSLHVMRASAIILMVQVHFVGNLSSPRGEADLLYRVSDAVGSLAAPIFTMLVGMSLWLWIRKNGMHRNPGLAIARRGVALFVLGLVFAMGIWLPGEVFNWDILPFIGVSTLILYPLRKLPSVAFVLLAIGAIAIAPPLREATGYAAHWVGGEYQYAFTVRDVVFGFLLHGYFPFFPWIALPLVGFATGKAFLGNGETSAASWRLPAMGGGLVALSIAGLAVADRFDGSSPARFLGGLSFYPASTTFVVGVSGVILLGFWGLYCVLDRNEMRGGAIIRFFRRYSAFSLSVYVIHHAVHVWPLYLTAIAMQKPGIWHFYQSAVTASTALLLALAFIAGFYPLLVLWERHRSWSLEAVLRRIAGS